ncbi:MAG: pentapeptide repeat-containing protein [Methylocella sp.]
MLDDTQRESISQANGEPGTDEAEALAAALNHSAERVQTLWFSFLTFMLYLAIAAGTTTHRMLFLEEPLNLPVLNIALPLLGFYILTPIIFVVFHFYMLLNLVLLARTAKSFEDVLARAFPEDGEARETFRMRIENTLFVQLLVGGRLEREGINAKFLSLMALITLALAPVALLLMIQFKFLPYHSEPITWLHRSLLALDLMLVWTLWPAYRSGWGVLTWPKWSWGLVRAAIGSTAALAFAVSVATLPDEQIYLAPKLRGNTPINTLFLRGEDLVDDAKLKQNIEKNESATGEELGENRWVASLSLAGRDLTGADLMYADVRHVDFSGAILNRAHLDFAWAKNARFDGAQLQGAQLDFAQLQGATLKFAQLQVAALSGAQLQGGSFVLAQLQGATLDAAVLLQGASLVSAQLQGAMFDYAQLQGASLNGAQLQGASFRNVFVWRADARKADWKDARIDVPKTGPKELCKDSELDCDWTPAAFEESKRLIAEQVVPLDKRRAAIHLIEQRLAPNKALKGEEEMAKVWADRERLSPTPDVYEKSLVEQWRKTGCAADGAPYVVRALLNRLDNPKSPEISPFGADSPQKATLAAAFLEKDCAGARGLSEAEIAKLKAIRDRALPPAPKP